MRKVTAGGLGIAFVLCGFSGPPAQAQSEAPSPCASVTDDQSRLQCYDAEHALKKSGSSARPSAATPAPQPAATPVARPAPAPAAASSVPAPAPKAALPAPEPAARSGSGGTGFGSETLPKKAKEGDAEEASEITAKVTSVAGRRKGDYRVTLDNGQVWAETQRTGGDPPQPGDTITLRRGAMGSYFLSRGSGLALRVTRVK